MTSVKPSKSLMMSWVRLLSKVLDETFRIFILEGREEEVMRWRRSIEVRREGKERTERMSLEEEGLER